MALRGVLAWSLVLLTVAGGVLDSVITGIAQDNLSNRSFERGHQWTPSDFGIPYSDVAIPSGAIQLAGWWMPGSSPSNLTVILVHGLGSNMSKPMRLWAPQLHELGYGVLAVDLRNHGASPDVAGGAVTYGMSEADDVAAAVTYLQDTAATKGIDPERIVLYGGSMGAATVLNTAARGLPGVVGVISDSSYASLSFQAHLDGHKQGYPGFVVDWVLARMDDLAPAPPTRSRPDLALAEMQVPVLLAHCSNDARIAVASYDRLVALAPSGTTTWSHPCPTGLSADHHLDGWMSASYNSTVSAFLGRL